MLDESGPVRLSGHEFSASDALLKPANGHAPSTSLCSTVFWQALTQCQTVEDVCVKLLLTCEELNNTHVTDVLAVVQNLFVESWIAIRDIETDAIHCREGCMKVGCISNSGPVQALAKLIKIKRMLPPTRRTRSKEDTKKITKPTWNTKLGPQCS